MRTGENADIPTTGETDKVIAYLLKSTANSQKILIAMLGELVTTAITDTTILEKWEAFSVTKHKPIFTNSVMLGRAGKIRVTLGFNRAVKLVSYINNIPLYLNTKAELDADCMYVFDIPINPNDSLNLAAEFDDADIKTATISFIRLQEVR